MQFLRNSFYAIITLCLFTGCTPDKEPPKANTHYIHGRDILGARPPLYRVKMPAHWIRRDPLPNESLVDTKKSICDFFIYENGKVIRIAIHNFPTNSIEERIPAKAQVERWQRQFADLYPEETEITPQCFNGYCGLLLEASGQIEQEETSILAWALLIGREHYRALSYPRNEKEKIQFPQMRADVTIKATGPTDLVKKHRSSIVQFAQSFELIEEVPSES